MARTPVSNPATPVLSLRYTPIPQAHNCITCSFANPDPLTGQKVPGAEGPNVTVSVQPDGTLTATPPGAAGAYELASIDGGGNLTFWPGQAKLGPANQWGICYKFLGSVNVPEVG